MRPSSTLAWKAANIIIQVTTASMSLVASTIIVVMIFRAGLTSPYRRLIFSMSFADIFQSLALLTGPFSSPRGTIVAPWAVGSIQTCSLNGISFVFGTTAATMYLCTLSLYYFCKLYLKMNDDMFRSRVETKAHVVVITTTLAITISGALTESFNTIPNGGACHFARYPTGCGSIPGYDCTRGLHTRMFLMLVTIGINGVCFIGIFFFMSMLVRYALYTERMFILNPVYRLPSERPQLRRCCLDLCCWLREHDQQEEESDADYVLRLYRRETVTQAFLYVFFFLLTYSLSAIMVMLGLMGFTKMPKFLVIITVIFYPVMGLFNILIYCRPKVRRNTFDKFTLFYIIISW